MDKHNSELTYQSEPSQIGPQFPNQCCLLQRSSAAGLQSVLACPCASESQDNGQAGQWLRRRPGRGGAELDGASAVKLFADLAWAGFSDTCKSQEEVQMPPHLVRPDTNSPTRELVVSWAMRLFALDPSVHLLCPSRAACTPFLHVSVAVRLPGFAMVSRTALELGIQGQKQDKLKC